MAHPLGRPMLGLMIALCLASPAPAVAAAVCDGLTASRPQSYRSLRFGVSMTHPSSITIVPGSLTENGDTVRFKSADARVSVTITMMPNTRDETVAELYREAEQDVIQNSRGMIDFVRRGEGWFIMQGEMVGRIYYRRTVLLQRPRAIGTLWIEYPRELRACMEEIIPMMSRSFG